MADGHKNALPEIAGVAAGGEVVPDVDAVALAVGRHLAADVAHVVAVKLGLQKKSCNAIIDRGLETLLAEKHYVIPGWEKLSHLQVRSGKRWAVGCVIPASWLPLATGGEFTQPTGG